MSFTLPLVLMATCAALAVVLLLARHRRKPQRLHVRAEGLSGPLEVYDRTWEDGRPVRVLASGRALQSATYLDGDVYDPVFEYYVLYDLMFEGAHPVGHVLMLGGGGYGYPRYLLHGHSDVSMDVVEIDPAVTRLAKRYFGLDELIAEVGLAPEGRLRLVTADAREFLARGDERYDAILNDCFSGDVPAPALATLEAARAVHDRLAPGGMFLSNVVAALEGPRGALLRSLVRTYGEVFSYVYVVPCRRNPADAPDNNMLVATDVPFDCPGATRVEVSGTDPISTDAHNLVELQLRSRGRRG